MDKVLALLRPFMKKELMDMMQLHPSLETFLDKQVPKSMMPEEYGGSAGKMKDLTDKIYKSIQLSPEFFEVEEKTNRVNEKLRPGKPRSESDLFGIEGNFKQLQFD